MASRAYYAASIDQFLDHDAQHVLGAITEGSSFPVETLQRNAWLDEIRILTLALQPYRGRGKLYFEYSIPRLGQRIDIVLVIDNTVFVIEFKVGEAKFLASAVDQVWDYALDLKNFHETSHNVTIAPVLVATHAKSVEAEISTTGHNDGLLRPICTAADDLEVVIRNVLAFSDTPSIDVEAWEDGRYCPTPTIIEAAQSLYRGHHVADISRNDASAINLSRTSDAIAEVIRHSRHRGRKSICFVTGVPGAGKTLVGLNVATQHIDQSSDLYSVFLSGNGPLVAVLREALAQDKLRRQAEIGLKTKKGAVRSEVKSFIQNVHHFRDECLIDRARPPIEHVALFDEAQRAWNVEQTSKFMRQKKGMVEFHSSEPEFLIACLDRHPDWAVVVCLVGGGQEINTGEAGISEWLQTVARCFPAWDVYISSKLHDSEYASNLALKLMAGRPGVQFLDELHLAVSMRSFRAESVSAFVKHLLDQNAQRAHDLLQDITGRYPIVMTRELQRAKNWLRSQARGTERFGIVVSSQAYRLKPHAIDVRSPVDPVHWFLDDKEDVRSSYYLEDVATEFHVQGLELDWGCVVWDADFRHDSGGWRHYSFVGNRWNQVRKPERQQYMKNAYRVLLTRSRQGMVIVVPTGDPRDPTRRPEFYDATYAYLHRIGLSTI